MEYSRSSEKARKLTSITLAGILAVGICANEIKNHRDNRIAVSQGKSCEGSVEVLALGDTVEDIAKKQALNIGVTANNAAYVAEFIIRANPRDSFEPTADGNQKIVSKTILTPTSCEL